MPKKIKNKLHDCRQHLEPRGPVILGIRNKSGLLEVPGQPQAELVPGIMVQCKICKNAYLMEKKPSEITPPQIIKGGV